MSEFSKTRRQLLRSSAAWVGGLAALATARPAGAAMQQVGVSAQSPLGIAIVNRCKVQSADHDAIRARLMAELAAEPSLGTLTERCPLCGCPVTVSR
jgi:hypothetical protein